MLACLPFLSTTFSLGGAPTVRPATLAFTRTTRMDTQALTPSGLDHKTADATAAARSAAALLELKTDDQLTAMLATGSPSVVLFAAKWCAACRRVEARMKRLARGRPGISFLIVHHSKLTSDMFESHGVSQLPLLKTFDENGLQVGEVLIERPYELEKVTDEELRRVGGFSP